MEYGTLAEKKALSARSGYWAGGAILLVILSIGALSALPSGGGSTAGVIFLVARLIGIVMWVVGCAYYARSKGWSGVLGILGILTCIGLLVLVLLPDKWKKALDANPGGGFPGGPTDLTNYPR